jgi:hypothetical protein
MPLNELLDSDPPRAQRSVKFESLGIDTSGEIHRINAELSSEVHPESKFTTSDFLWFAISTKSPPLFDFDDVLMGFLNQTDRDAHGRFLATSALRPASTFAYHSRSRQCDSRIPCLDASIEPAILPQPPLATLAVSLHVFRLPPKEETTRAIANTRRSDQSKH